MLSGRVDVNGFAASPGDRPLQLCSALPTAPTTIASAGKGKAQVRMAAVRSEKRSFISTTWGDHFFTGTSSSSGGGGGGGGGGAGGGGGGGGAASSAAGPAAAAAASSSNSAAKKSGGGGWPSSIVPVGSPFVAGAEWQQCVAKFEMRCSEMIPKAAAPVLLVRVTTLPPNLPFSLHTHTHTFTLYFGCLAPTPATITPPIRKVRTIPLVPPSLSVALYYAMDVNMRYIDDVITFRQVCGGKDAGKSTMARWAVNSLLNSHEAVAYLDCKWLLPPILRPLMLPQPTS